MTFKGEMTDMEPSSQFIVRIALLCDAECLITVSN